MNIESLEKPLLPILNEARAIAHTEYGTMQIYNPHLGGFEIAAQYGFDPSTLEFFRLVRPGDACSCGRALQLARRVVILDVTTELFFGPSAAAAVQAGFRSVQTTPILGNQNNVIGALSTHSAKTLQLSRADLLAIDQCVLRAKSIIQVFLKKSYVLQNFGYKSVQPPVD